MVLRTIRLSHNIPRTDLKLPYISKQAPFTPTKGLVGRALRTKLLVRRSQDRTAFWFKDLIGTRFFQKKLILSLGSAVFFGNRKVVTFFKSSAGCLMINSTYFTKPLQYEVLDLFNLVTNRTLSTTARQLLFVKVGSRISHIRDIFKTKHLFSNAFNSQSRILFFDR